MPGNLENSAVASGLEKVNFHSNLKEGQCQKLFKQQHNHFTGQQGNAQNSPRKASTVRELKTSRCTRFRKDRETRDQIAKICWFIEKANEFQRNILCFIHYAKAFDCVDHNKLWKLLKEMGIPDHFT